MSGSPFSKKAQGYLIAALAVPCLVIAGAAYLAYNSIHQMDDAIRLVDHTFEVRTRIDRLRQLLVDAETGERGFVLTFNPVFLDSYRKAVSIIPTEIDNIAALTRDNPAQQELAEEIKKTARRKLDWMAESIANEEKGAHAEVTRMIATGQGQAIMDQLRELLGTMEERESRLLAERQQQIRHSANLRTYLIFFLLAANVVFAAAAYYAILRIRKLQGFVKMCAWSRTIEFEGKWMTFESYLYKRFGLQTSHGMSPQEFERFEEGLSNSRHPHSS
ncbi:MAG: CHASE3 domain-containing protein [Nibricoccus sp.]